MGPELTNRAWGSRREGFEIMARSMLRGTGRQVRAAQPERDPLTRRQKQVLDFISRCIDERGYPPTLREIGQHMSIRSTNGVNDHLKALERKGYLKREDLKARAMRSVEPDSAARVPLVGQVAAGEPLLATENVEDVLKVDRSLLGRSEDVFALRVKGDSMIEDGIFDGDLVFVRRQPTASPGETVVALVEDEATVKRYYPEQSRIRLQPANASMAPIYVNEQEQRALDILGVVIGVFRRL